MRGLTPAEVTLLSAQRGENFESTELYNAAKRLEKDGRVKLTYEDEEGFQHYEATPAGREALRIHYALLAAPVG